MHLKAVLSCSLRARDRYNRSRCLSVSQAGDGWRRLRCAPYFCRALCPKPTRRRNPARNSPAGWSQPPSSARTTLSATFPPTSAFHTLEATSPPTPASVPTRSSGPTERWASTCRKKFTKTCCDTSRPIPIRAGGSSTIPIRTSTTGACRTSWFSSPAKGRSCPSRIARQTIRPGIWSPGISAEGCRTSESWWTRRRDGAAGT